MKSSVRVVLTVIFVGLAIAAIVVGAASFAQFRDRHWLPMIAPVLVLMVGLPIALNQFGWERNAASYLFALPARPRAVIVGKNLAAMTGLLAETLFLGCLLAWFSSSWQWMPLLLPVAIGTICCLLAVGNLVSILTPLRLPGKAPTCSPKRPSRACSRCVTFCSCAP